MFTSVLILDETNGHILVSDYYLEIRQGEHRTDLKEAYFELEELSEILKAVVQLWHSVLTGPGKYRVSILFLITMKTIHGQMMALYLGLLLLSELII